MWYTNVKKCKKKCVKNVQKKLKLKYALFYFRFLPKNKHPLTVYVREGVEVDKERSDSKSVTLRNLVQSSTGRYRCEVSSEAPSFATASQFGDMIVVGKKLILIKVRVFIV
jgi:hypothetical protein